MKQTAKKRPVRGRPPQVATAEKETSEFDTEVQMAVRLAERALSRARTALPTATVTASSDDLKRHEGAIELAALVLSDLQQAGGRTSHPDAVRFLRGYRASFVLEAGALLQAAKKVRGRPPQVESKLKAFIAENPGCSRRQIAEGIGHSYEHVTELVSKLRVKRVVLEKERRLRMRAGRARVAA